MTEESEVYFDFYESIEICEKHLSGKLVTLRQKLKQKAKEEKHFRFYSLYNHIIHPDTLMNAWKQVRDNRGSCGVDGVTIKEVEEREGGVQSFLREIEQSLVDRSYKPDPVLRVYIEKANGKLRPLGIPTVRDRVIQTALLLILDPIFEADFKDCSYGFRPGRSAHDALKMIGKHLKEGYCAVYDADLKGYFDSIPHDKLIACVRMRVVDGSVLNLLRMWLKAPVSEKPKGGGQARIKRTKKGTPQGGVISPLLANIYLHWFDRAFHCTRGPAEWAKAKLVRYADDFVVLARYIGPELEQFIESKIERWLGLEINREKTRIFDSRSQGETLDFLGYSFRFDRDLYGRRLRYWNLFPSSKSLQREQDRLKEMTNCRKCFKPLRELIKEVNDHLQGWTNYYQLGYPRKAFRTLNSFVRKRLTRHAQRRSQRGYRPPSGKSFYAHLSDLGLRYL